MIVGMCGNDVSFSSACHNNLLAISNIIISLCAVIQADIAEEAARICKANPGAQTRHIQKPDWNGKRASTSIDSDSGSDTGYLQVIVQ